MCEQIGRTPYYLVITREEQCSKCSFIVAKFSQKELPYTFHEREGSFNPHTQYVAIKLKQFSLVGETSPENTELCFTSLKFYRPIPGTLKVDFVFIVVNNHELFLEVHYKTPMFLFTHLLLSIVQSVYS